MCGIAGFVNLDSSRPASQPLLEAMTDSIAHRGPDDRGYYVSGPVALGHRRLSILDLEGGHQPWLDASRDRALVYNGEIYNFAELMAEESRSGAVFRSRCDTEVLMHLADTRTTDWLHRFNGMFAFALWDGNRRELLLVRDRLGIKPVYYCIHDGRLFFASEIKALLAGGVPARVNSAAVPEYLAYRIVSGAESMVKDVFALPPGHVLRLRCGAQTPEIERYWDSRPCPAGRYVDSALPVAEQFDALLESSIRYRLVADVPLGTFNSGGVDSSLITARVRQQTQGELHTFSVGFDEDTYDESRYARIVADQLGTNHHVLVLNGREYADGFEAALLAADQPMFQGHTVQLQRLSALAKQYVTVVLTGEGADELFAGYPRYQIPLLAKRMTALPQIVNRGLLAASRSLGQRRLVKLFEVCSDADRAVVENARFCTTADLEEVGVRDIAQSGRFAAWRAVQAKGLPSLEAVLDYDRNTYMIGLLHRLDFTTMASGLEARVPFLDYRLVEWSMSQPANVKVRVGSRNKILVKQIAAQVFPHDMIYRRKVGFGVPFGPWFRRPDSLGRFLDLLTDSTFAQRGLCDATGVGRLIEEHRRGDHDHGDLLWSLVNLEWWCRNLEDQNRSTAVPS
jgi:asparagine synthase (glutamine-hydrolysing)